MSKNKQELREKGMNILKHMPTEKKHKIEEKLHKELYATRQWKQAQTVGLTVSQALEWDTRAIIQQAWDEHKTVCVPKCDPKEKTMDFYQLNNFDQLEVVYYNLLEPNPQTTSVVEKKEIDLLLVPGLLFDVNGYRIGFGGGFYDRFLSDFNQDTVSLLSSKQLIPELPVELFDKTVQQLLTENGPVSLEGR